MPMTPNRCAEEFEALLASRKQQTPDQWSDLELGAVKSQLDDLREEIDEYENFQPLGN